MAATDPIKLAFHKYFGDGLSVTPPREAGGLYLLQTKSDGAHLALTRITVHYRIRSEGLVDMPQGPPAQAFTADSMATLKNSLDRDRNESDVKAMLASTWERA